MTRYSDTDALSQAGDRPLGAARRHPEALLLLAAGCCLLIIHGSATGWQRLSPAAVWERIVPSPET
jgi:hypothetical protein